VPMVLRRIKPAAVRLVSGVLVDRPELLDHMPTPLPKMRYWLRAVRFAADAIDADYALWVARNYSKFNGYEEIEDLTDWALNSRARTQGGRPFVLSMSVRTVRELSVHWHEVVARKVDEKSRPFPEPWFPAGRLSSGQEIVPITNSADLYREG